MNKRICSWILLFVFLFSFPFTVWAEEESLEEMLAAYMNRYYTGLVDTIVENYKFDITKEELYEVALRELIGADAEKMEKIIQLTFDQLDENSSYLPAEEFDSFMSDLTENLYGVGLLLQNTKSGFMVTGFPMGDSPGEQAGIRIGDYIVSVNGEDVTQKSFEELLSLVRGELGTTVQLGMKRQEEILTFTLTRIKIKQSFVDYQFLPGEVLQISLSSFNEGCSEDVKQALEEARKLGVTKILLDLRNNHGGYADEAIAIASMLLPKNSLITILSYKEEGDIEKVVSDAKFRDKKYDITILVNEDTGSASELLTAALRDSGDAYVVGTQTFGKGTGQSILSILPFQAHARLTIFEYLTPKGEKIHRVGLSPDEQVLNHQELVNESDSFLPITFQRKLYLGDSGEDVAALRQRLYLLGYYVGDPLEESFDTLLCDMVKTFQAENNLYPCGDLDMATQTAIYGAVNAMEVTIDDQYNAAYEYAKNRK